MLTSKSNKDKTRKGKKDSNDEERKPRKDRRGSAAKKTPRISNLKENCTKTIFAKTI